MLRRTLLSACVLVALVSIPAGATTIRGRGSATQAAMDAHVVEAGTHRVRVLSQLCVRPSRIQDCSDFPRRLRRAIEDAFTRPITWVDARPSTRPEFLVFAPVVFGRGTAVASYAWWKPNASVCRGGGEEHYEREHGTWRSVLALGWAIACR